MDSALKQRLLGAVVLIALAVIFVPMFLGKSPAPQKATTLNLAIPPPPQRSFQTQTLPVNPPPAQSDANKVVTVDTDKLPKPSQSGTESGSAKSPMAVHGSSTQTQKSTAPAAAPSQPVAPTPENKQAKPATGTMGSFAVHLGAYADRGHADALVAKVKKLGYPAYDEPAEFHGKPVLRVRVGPYDTRAAAETVRLKIKQSEPRVPSSVVESAVDSKTDAPASAVPAARAGGWAVQLGAFSARADANKLRDRLRNGGIASFVDYVKSNGKTLWRVRAGPFAARGDAEKTRDEIKKKYRVNGLIVTQP